MPKYLLCRPRGGLNDALNQIENCFQYAEIYNRILIIDTEYMVSSGISVEFSKLFVLLKSDQSISFKLTPTLLEGLNKLSTFPTSCEGQLNKYKTRLNEILVHVDSDTNTKLSFDFNQNYDEDLLVHDQFGGGFVAINCLARLKLTSRFRDDVLSTISPLMNNEHIAIHVRHSDYQTDYQRSFEEIYEKSIKKRLLICSDSNEVIRFAHSFFDQSEVFTLSIPPDTNGIGLPTYATFNCNDEQRYELIVKAFSDLIGLATGSEIFYCKLTPGKFSDAASKYPDFSTFSSYIKSNSTKSIGETGLSGFSVLVEQLRLNPSVINQLLTP